MTFETEAALRAALIVALIAMLCGSLPARATEPAFDGVEAIKTASTRAQHAAIATCTVIRGIATPSSRPTGGRRSRAVIWPPCIGLWPRWRHPEAPAGLTLAALRLQSPAFPAGPNSMELTSVYQRIKDLSTRYESLRGYL